MVNKVQPFEKLVKYIKNNAQKGLTIPHQDVENVIGIPYRLQCKHINSQYSYQVQKANKKLTELSLRLEAIQGFGYRIIEDNQYVDSMRKAYNRGVRSIEKAKFIADNTDIQNLSKKDLKEFNDVYDKIVDTQSYISIIPSPIITKKSNTP